MLDLKGYMKIKGMMRLGQETKEKGKENGEEHYM